MNSDIRLSVAFWDHPKTVKLERRLGLPGVKSLQILWLWAAQNRPNGDLGVDEEDIEIAARWTGENGKFLSCLVDLRWIDRDEDGYSIHDWEEHNSWASKADYQLNLTDSAMA
jgi:hypothetical protein